MTSSKVIGVYAVPGAEEKCHMIELAISGSSGVFPVGDITQEVADESRENWQVPYTERLVSADGKKILTEEFEAEAQPELWEGDFRLVFFFHRLDTEKPLITPFGKVPLPAPSAVPARLSDIGYEAP
jgi:hypothetical protein